MHIITMLLLLSVLILVHELGHFGIAKMLGIRVERFGFGLPFGPTLYEKKIGDTTVCIHAFLLGGYVGFPDDDPDSDLPQDHPDRISNRPVWQRFLVVSAGVTANAICAFVLVLLVAIISGGIPAGKYNIYSAGVQKEKGLTAQHINILDNDRIKLANGMVIDSPMKFIELAQRSKKFDNYVTETKIEKQLEKIKKSNPSIKSDVNTVLAKDTKIILPKADYEAPVTLPDNYFYTSKDYKPAGIKLTSKQQSLRNKLDDKKSYTSKGEFSLYEIAAATADTTHPITIVVERENKEITLPPAYPNEKGLIGIKLKMEEIIVPTAGFVTAISGSWNYLYQNTYLMIDGLANLIMGKVPLENLHGIVAITKVGSDIIEHKGLWDGLLLTALISMDLAIVNLLPIPALDGGHIVFLMIEKLIGRPVEQETQEALAKYGFMFLIGLMVLIIFNDIFALVTDKL